MTKNAENFLNLLEWFLWNGYSEHQGVTEQMLSMILKTIRNKDLSLNDLINEIDDFLNGNHDFSNLLTDEEFDKICDFVRAKEDEFVDRIGIEEIEMAGYYDDEGNWVAEFIVGDLFEGFLYFFLHECFNETYESIQHEFEYWLLKKLKKVYKHYKGNYYEVISDRARFEKELSKVVVYRSLLNLSWWVRPYDEFFELVDGKPRFEEILKEEEI